MHPSPRIRRLNSDRKALEQLQESSSIFWFEATGDPPNFYRLKFNGKGLARAGAEAPVYFQTVHEIHMRLGANYPRQMPELSWKTPIFHPNISASGFVCLGGYGTHWTPGITLDELCCMLWDMIRYENFDVASPYNREAAGWVNEQTGLRMPLDHRPLRDRIAQVSEAAQPPVGSHQRAIERPMAGGPQLDWHAPQSPLAPLHTAVREANSNSNHVRAPAPQRRPSQIRPPAPAPSDSGVIFLDDAVVEAECITVDADLHTAADGDIVFLS